MAIPVLEKLMRIRYNGPPASEFDFSGAIKLWKKAAKRKIGRVIV